MKFMSMKKVFLVINCFIFLTLLFPVFATFAQTPVIPPPTPAPTPAPVIPPPTPAPTPATPDSPGAPTAQPTPVPANSNSGLSFSIKNPLKFKSIPELFNAILNIFIVILTPLVVIFIILAGFKYVMAQGNPAKIQEATQALTYAIIGGILIVGATAITAIIGNFINAFAA
jgi:hypothetical protein